MNSFKSFSQRFLLYRISLILIFFTSFSSFKPFGLDVEEGKILNSGNFWKGPILPKFNDSTILSFIINARSQDSIPGNKKQTRKKLKTPRKDKNPDLHSSNHHILRILIDPGHGGKDPGAHGKRFKEKNITLAIALELKKQFKDHYPEIQVILSRNEDKFIELDDRALMAKRKKADIFISIHCNANANTMAKGPEAYAIGLNSTPENLRVAERENSVILLESGYKERYEGFNPHSPESYIIFSLLQQYNINQSLKLAGKMEQSLSDKTSDSRGVKQAGFLVLRRNTVPSILLEIGFITNPEEEKRLGSTAGQHRIAKEILKGFENYRNSIEN